MYQQENNRREFGRNRVNNQKRRFSNNNGGGRGGRRGSFGQSINVSKFIKKAEPQDASAPFVPVHMFRDFSLDGNLLNNIAKKGYTQPTQIQDKAIPYVMEGKDVVGVANTGTGKTGAFLIPLLQKVINNPREKVLIICPTRELALQIDVEFKQLAFGLRLNSVCCVGGDSIGKQLAGLRNRSNFVIGTPGRLKDLYQRRAINFFEFSNLVLDEADRMLDMGFVNEMRFVMSKMPKERQTLFFSATISPNINALIAQFVKDPVLVSVKTGDTAKNVDQDIVRVQGGAKIEILFKLLTSCECHKALVFGRTKHGVEKLSKALLQKGVKAVSIHGNKSQSQREKALGCFRKNQVNVLIATDVAARGLDIPDISHVINYDIPATYDDYVHRIGRTGRGDHKGKALTFVD